MSDETPTYDWPGHWPDGCPREDHAPMSGDHFRFVRNDPPIRADFRETAEDGNRRAVIRNGEVTCLGRSVSVYTTRESAAKAAKRASKLQKMKIACGNLSAEDGVGDRNEATKHCSWWIPKDHDPSGKFSVVP